MIYYFTEDEKIKILNKELKILDIGCGNNLKKRYDFLDDNIFYENITSLYYDKKDDEKEKFHIGDSLIIEFKNKINLLELDFMEFNDGKKFDIIFAEQVFHYPSFYSGNSTKKGDFYLGLYLRLNKISNIKTEINISDTSGIEDEIWNSLFKKLVSKNINICIKTKSGIKNFKNVITND